MSSQEKRQPQAAGSDRVRPIRESIHWQARARHGNGPAVLVVRVDQAAELLQAHGKAAGEQLMLAVTSALQRRLRPHDRLALVRDDEFLLVLGGVTPQTVRRIEHRVAEAVRSLHLSMGGRMWALTCSIGMACAPEGRFPMPSVQTLVREADADLHRVIAQQARRQA